MNFLPVIATATEDLGHSHSVMDALPHLGGMLMVLVTLTALWGLTVIVSKAASLVKSTPHANATPIIVPSAIMASAPQSPDSIPPEIVAVISAAVASVAGGNRRVISIKPMNTSWEKAGRQSVLTSHRIR